MTYDPQEGANAPGPQEMPMTASISAEQGDAMMLASATGLLIAAAVGAARHFVGWSEEATVGTVSSGDLLRVSIEAQTKTDVLIVGTGGSGVLQNADIGSTVFCTGANAYTVVEAVNGVKCGTLTRIRSAGTSSDGRGDIEFLGFDRDNLQEMSILLADPTDLSEVLVSVIAILRLLEDHHWMSDT